MASPGKHASVHVIIYIKLQPDQGLEISAFKHEPGKSPLPATQSFHSAMIESQEQVGIYGVDCVFSPADLIKTHVFHVWFSAEPLKAGI